MEGTEELADGVPSELNDPALRVIEAKIAEIDPKSDKLPDEITEMFGSYLRNKFGDV